jgi:hypothetical protein
LIQAEQKVEAVEREVADLVRSREAVFRPPPREWVEHRLQRLSTVLRRDETRSALVLRQFLGPIVLTPVEPEIGRPYYHAHTTMDVLALVDAPSEK